MTTLAFYSNKGGVGKTATAVNLSYLAAQSGAKTLICDLDPQGSATYYFRVKPKLKPGAKGFVKGGRHIDKSIRGTDYKNLDLLPADFTHRNLDITFTQLRRSKQRLGKIINPLKDEYDIIFLDCPASISILAENILKAADYALVPLIPTTLSIHTHEQLIAFCKKRKYDVGKIHTFFSMVDRRKKMHNDIMSIVSEKFDSVLQTSIPYLAQIEKMGIVREPVPSFSPKSIASTSYHRLWENIRTTLFFPCHGKQRRVL